MVKRFWQENSTLGALIILFVVSAILSREFINPHNLMNILRQISTIGLISIGMTFVIIGGGIDLSAGAALAMCGGIIVTLQAQNVPVVICILAGCLTGALIGLLNGLFITKAKLAPFIVTLASGAIARSVIVELAKGSTIIGNNTSDFTNLGNGNVLGFIPIPAVILLIFGVAGYVLLNKTKFGTYVFAIGGNENCALYSGIKVDQIKIITYVIMGVCVGMGASIESARLASVSSSSSGLLYELDAITAVIIGGASLNGGKGKISGTIIGMIILGIVSNMMNMMNISPYLNGAVKGMIILVAVLLQKKGR